jgi:hypothetical protein
MSDRQFRLLAGNAFSRRARPIRPPRPEWIGTEPKLRVMVEGPDEGRIGTIAQDLLAAARRDVG